MTRHASRTSAPRLPPPRQQRTEPLVTAAPCARLVHASRHLPDPPGKRTGRRVGSWPRSASRKEHEFELADLELVPADQLALLDPLTVEVGAVQRADVVDGEAPPNAAPDLGVTSGHGDVVQEDVALGMAAGCDHVLVQEEAAAGVRAAADDQHGRAVAELFDW